MYVNSSRWLSIDDQNGVDVYQDNLYDDNELWWCGTGVPGTVDPMYFVSLYQFNQNSAFTPFVPCWHQPRGPDISDGSKYDRADVEMSRCVQPWLWLPPFFCSTLLWEVVEVVGVKVVIELLIEVVKGVVEEEEVVVVLGEGISGMDLNKGTKVTAVDTDNCTDRTEFRPRLNSHPFYQKLSSLLLLARENWWILIRREKWQQWIPNKCTG